MPSAIQRSLPFVVVLIAAHMAGNVYATTPTTSQVVAEFDKAVSAGLPQVLQLPPESHLPHELRTDTQQHRGPDAQTESLDLIVQSRMRSAVIFPDDTVATLYDATWNGTPVVITRIGERLDITSHDAEAIDVTGFVADRDRIDHHGVPVSSAPVDTGPNARRADAHAGLAVNEPAAPIMENASPYIPGIDFWIFVHDDALATGIQRIHSEYVAWWIADLQRNVITDRDLRVWYRTTIPTVTDFNYADRPSLITEWQNTARAYFLEREVPRHPQSKYLLLTRHLISHTVEGRAQQGGDAGLASLRGDALVIAHEFGHMLGATHEDSEVRGCGLWACHTTMDSGSFGSFFRAATFDYSPGNKANIRASLP
ncbi:reprolysin-like metallo-peptidase family M12B [Luteibacter rhizovicinus]|uniref:Reprolysin-like metallo-peptidase family M12B n=1 Tax=Luteibacter rhizovicinus TaxID=242606 RepID=A0A4R3YMG3_9GAMM|nr:hypothetical protein [Luteibacter rhizovicinus]TCV93995.1 reprolysin-like metallo-peptidase family M12B [Luteibacter rhizovicinus]